MMENWHYVICKTKSRVHCSIRDLRMVMMMMMMMMMI